MDDTISITFWVTGFVFVAINLFMAYAVIRYRYKKGVGRSYEPENKKLEWWLTGLTTAGVAAMLAPGLFVWAKFVEVPKDAGVFEAVGKQWHWSFRFPGKDGVLGTVDAKHVSDKNPFGMNPDDPNGQDDVLVSSPELHLPIGKPVQALLRSVDVLHNFAVPQFRAKMDLVPGLVTYIWFHPHPDRKIRPPLQRIVRHRTLCHAWQRGSGGRDRFSGVAERLSDVRASLSSNRRRCCSRQAAYAVCAACHGSQAEGNPALNAPKLSGQGDWYLKRQLKNFQDRCPGYARKRCFR